MTGRMDGSSIPPLCGAVAALAWGRYELRIYYAVEGYLLEQCYDPDDQFWDALYNP